MDNALEQTITVPEKAPEVNVNKYDEILRKIENPNCPVADVSRLIAIEIAKATRDMAKLMTDPTMAWKFKPYAAHVKALRELSKQLSETEVLSRKDTLNIDGPKCQFLVREMAKLYKKALKEAGCEGSLIESAMRHFADLLSVDDERIRRELDRIDSSGL